MPSLQTKQLLNAAVDACDSRKAEDITILALDPAESSLTDYFLICNGTNERQNVAISDEIEHRLKQEFNTYPNSVEGRRQGEWVLMDYVDFVVHIFMPEKRAYYGLERLRKSAKSISLADLNDEIKSALTSLRTALPRTPPVASEGHIAGLPQVRKRAAKRPSKKAAVARKTPGKKTATKAADKKPGK